MTKTITKNKQTYISHDDFRNQFKQLLKDRYKSCCKELDEDKDLYEEEREMVISETQDMFNEVDWVLFGVSQKEERF